MSRKLVTFDFDWSLSEQDTDRWVFEVLDPIKRRQMKSLKSSIQWTDLVALKMKELHDDGKSREEIENALKVMPFHPAMKRALENLKHRNPDVDLVILSNSNEVYIRTILQDKKILHLFDAIITNKAEWSSSGCLNVSRRVDPNGPQHGCSVGCSPNMCKGEELESYVAAKGGWDAYNQVFYVGDGGNDYCPLLHLRSQDTALARYPRPLINRIEKEGNLKCSVVKWVGAWEVEEILDKL
ncbi:Inorganic pyrophosphatase 1 [Wallemia ichthyophaga EXF-994]|nr:Inorganic pyrophosphatase 1 [Wallemia ichthyophaga EXF-994]EOQ99334.1 Inorganic pyrophosphatase 1 [Wallemia ichthyophaga EXF-994]